MSTYFKCFGHPPTPALTLVIWLIVISENDCRQREGEGLDNILLPGTCVIKTAPAATNVTSKLQSTSKRTPSHLEHPSTIMTTEVF